MSVHTQAKLKEKKQNFGFLTAGQWRKTLHKYVILKYRASQSLNSYKNKLKFNTLILHLFRTFNWDIIAHNVESWALADV
jgi:hypothetical protein